MEVSERKELAYKIHKKAMDHCHSAAVTTGKKHCDQNLELALYLEISAAYLCQEILSKAVLFRSAAAIAVELDEKLLAKNLAEEGLLYSEAFESAAEITKELKDILDQIK